MRLKRLIGGLIFATVAQISPLLALDVDATLQRLSDMRYTAQLETRLADILARNDRDQLRALKTEFEKQDGFRLAEVFSWMDTERRRKAPKGNRLLEIGACQFAGMQLRKIIGDLADGNLKAAHKAGVWIFDPGEPDERYNMYANTCETSPRGGFPKNERKIGSDCAMTGAVCPREP